MDSWQGCCAICKLVEGKGWLTRMALEAEDLLLEECEDTLCLPWLLDTAHGDQAVDAALERFGRTHTGWFYIS